MARIQDPENGPDVIFSLTVAVYQDMNRGPTSCIEEGQKIYIRPGVSEIFDAAYHTVVFAALLPLEAQGAISCSTRTNTQVIRTKALGVTVSKRLLMRCGLEPVPADRVVWHDLADTTRHWDETMKTCVKKQPFCR